MSKPVTIFFAIFASFYLLTMTDYITLPVIVSSGLVKIIPMLVLIFFVFKNQKETWHKVFLLGLCFSALGDFLLNYDPINYFAYGLLAFLVAHLFYLGSLRPLSADLIKKRWLFAVLYFVLAGSCFFLFSANLGDLFVPVLVYMIVLLVMAITTLFSEKSNVWLLMGGLSFVISDSLIALNKFYTVVPDAGLYIMVSYYFAQFALTKGMFTQKSED